MSIILMTFRERLSIKILLIFAEKGYNRVNTFPSTHTLNIMITDFPLDFKQLT